MLKKMLKHPEDPEDLDLRTLAASIHAQCLGNAQQCQLVRSSSIEYFMQSLLTVRLPP